MTYVVERREAQMLNLNRGEIVDCVRFVVIWQGDKLTAWEGRAYPSHAVPPNAAAIAGKNRLRWQRYYDRTGRRFEVEQRAEAAAKRAADDAARKAAQRVRDAAPLLLAAAQRALTVLEGVAVIRQPGDTLDELAAAIAAATGEA